VHEKRPVDAENGDLKFLCRSGGTPKHDAIRRVPTCGKRFAILRVSL
jgi:hypothetical protein